VTPQPLSILQLVKDASLVVQFVLALLAIASIGSWAIILAKRSVLSRARAEAERRDEGQHDRQAQARPGRPTGTKPGTKARAKG